LNRITVRLKSDRCPKCVGIRRIDGGNYKFRHTIKRHKHTHKVIHEKYEESNLDAPWVTLGAFNLTDGGYQEGTYPVECSVGTASTWMQSKYRANTDPHGPLGANDWQADGGLEGRHCSVNDHAITCSGTLWWYDFANPPNKVFSIQFESKMTLLNDEVSAGVAYAQTACRELMALVNFNPAGPAYRNEHGTLVYWSRGVNEHVRLRWEGPANGIPLHVVYDLGAEVDSMANGIALDPLGSWGDSNYALVPVAPGDSTPVCANWLAGFREDDFRDMHLFGGSDEQYGFVSQCATRLVVAPGTYTERNQAEFGPSPDTNQPSAPPLFEYPPATDNAVSVSLGLASQRTMTYDQSTESFYGVPGPWSGKEIIMQNPPA